MLFKSEAPVYKVVKISPDLCLGFLKGNLSFCRRAHDECGANHGGEGSIQFAVEALALAKSPTTAFGPPLLETEALETDLVESILSSKVSFGEWNLTCNQIRSLKAPVSSAELKEEQDHLKRAKEHAQTPRKVKIRSNIDSDGWFGQDDDEDSVSQPFEKGTTFVSDGAARPVEDRVSLLERFLEVSTSEQKEISKTTGVLLKESKVAQEYHVTVMNEITGIVGLKSAKFPGTFDGPSLWSTIESLGNFVCNLDSNVPTLVANEFASQQKDMVTNILSKLRNEFVSEEDWINFLTNFGEYMTKEAADKQVYFEVMSACTKRLDELEKKSKLGTGPSSATRSRASYDPFHRAAAVNSPVFPDQQVAVADLNTRLEALESTIRLLKGTDTGDKIVRFGGLGFSTISDSCIWLDKNPEGIQFGFFIDVYNLCTLVSRAISGEKDYGMKMQTVKKLGLSNTQEFEALSAFQSPIPDLFTDGKAGLYGKNESAFPRFPKSKDWKTKIDRISTSINTVCHGLNTQIDMHISPHSDVNRLFKLAISLSSAFLQKFITWLTKSYEEAIEAGFKDEKAWCLTTKLGECVFRTIYEVRSGVSNSFTNEPKQMASVIWLTVGRTHDSMEDFMVKDFKNHSSINGEFIKFMVQNNNSDEVSTYRTELACVEQKMNNIKLEQNGKIKGLTDKFESTSKIAVNASNKAKTVEETLKKIQAQVGNLKKKE